MRLLKCMMILFFVCAVQINFAQADNNETISKFFSMKGQTVPAETEDTKPEQEPIAPAKVENTKSVQEQTVPSETVEAKPVNEQIAPAETQHIEKTSEPLVAEEKNIIRITAPKLVEEYDANEIAADEKYKGKTLQVKGIVEEIGKDLLGNMYIALRGDGLLLSVACFFEDDYAKQLAKISKDQRLTIEGVCDGLMMVVNINNSKIIEQ